MEYGEAIATKTVTPGIIFIFYWVNLILFLKKLGKEPEVVYHYKTGDYFGELALLRD